jgi:hypothetical protein
VKVVVVAVHGDRGTLIALCGRYGKVEDSIYCVWWIEIWSRVV